ncbi:MAG: hypothetical protein ACOYO1_09535 [Bacteroidales bacterium]
MKIYSISSILIILSLSFFSCNVKGQNIDYLIYGVFCGECVGHCATMYKLDNLSIKRDTADNFFKNKYKLDNGFFIGSTLNKKEFYKAKKLMKNIPFSLLNSKNKTFGNPDERDQCGIYIQIKIGNSIKIFTIDTDLSKIPSELHEFVQIIMKLTDQF